MKFIHKLFIIPHIPSSLKLLKNGFVKYSFALQTASCLALQVIIWIKIQPILLPSISTSVIFPKHCFLFVGLLAPIPHSAGKHRQV